MTDAGRVTLSIESSSRRGPLILQFGEDFDLTKDRSADRQPGFGDPIWIEKPASSEQLFMKLVKGSKQPIILQIGRKIFDRVDDRSHVRFRIGVHIGGHLA